MKSKDPKALTKKITVRTLINKLLDYDMNLPVEVVVYGEAGQRFACEMEEDHILEYEGHYKSVPVIFSAHEIIESDVEADEAESFQYYLNKSGI